MQRIICRSDADSRARVGEFMTDDQLEIQRLSGELHLASTERDWWAEEMLFWRTKFLKDHPNLATHDYVQSAREEEGSDDVMIFI